MTIYVKQVRKGLNGDTLAPGKCETTGRYLIYKLCENYDGAVKGGIRKTWRYVAKGLTLDEAKALFETKLGYKIYQ